MIKYAMHGRRNVWNIVGARCRVQVPTLLMPDWALVKGFLQRQYEAVIDPVRDDVCEFVATFRYFYCDIDPSIAKAFTKRIGSTATNAGPFFAGNSRCH